MKEYIGIASRNYLTANKDDNGLIGMAEVTLIILDKAPQISDGKVTMESVFEGITLGVDLERLDSWIGSLTDIRANLAMVSSFVPKSEYSGELGELTPAETSAD